MGRILSKKFYHQDTLNVAQRLLGCFLVREFQGKVWRARIVETEAYVGEEDLACHASRGRTKRTEVMYGEAGHAYVYMIYGMYFCLNIVTEKKDFPAAVLIRGVADLYGHEDCSDPHGPFENLQSKNIPNAKLNGPGKLCRELHIDTSLNTWDVTKGEKLWIERGALQEREKITASKRVGVDYAGHCREYLWRMTLTDTDFRNTRTNAD